MKLTRTFQLELAERKVDDARRTFAAVISTETPVKRRDFDGEFFEVLSHARGAVDLSRAPLPLIESHDARTLPVGIVDNVRIVDGKLRGDVAFGTSKRAQEIAADVEAGVIRNLSVGYTIDKVVEKVDGKQRTITAVRWTPHETSMVSIGADAGAGFGRSASMQDETETNTDNTEQLETRDAAALERARAVEITKLAKLAHLGEAWATRMIEEGTSIEAARSAALDERVRRDNEFQVTPGGDPTMYGGSAAVRTRSADAPWTSRARLTGGSDTGADFRAAAVDAILLRSGVPLSKPHPAAGDVSGSVLDLARTCVSRAGHTVRGGGGNEALIKRAMSTSDFPLILADVMNKSVRSGYETEPASHRAWVRPQAVPDFRSQNRPILGSAPALQAVVEGGEYTTGSLNEDSTSYAVSKYGRIVTLTQETLINDSLGAFLRIQPAMGQAARRLEADTVYTLLGANPTMQDSVALFHATHGNLGSSGAFDATILGAARALLRKQTAVGGGYLSLVPRFLIVPVEKETAAEMILAAATRSVTTTADTVPQWIAGLALVVEPRLASTAVYLAADSAQIDTCELGLLEENFSGPTITEDTSEAFKRDVFSWKVKHVIGAKFLDWRGIVKQPVT